MTWGRGWNKYATPWPTVGHSDPSRSCGSGCHLPAGCLQRISVPDDDDTCGRAGAPADAGPVTIVDTEIAAGTDGHRLVVEGTQPTPCHGLGWFVEPANGRVDVSVWSEPPPTGEVCAQVIEAFSIEIDLGAPDGGTEVVLNGQVVG